MAHYGTLNDARITDAADDIRGSHLYGLNDEKLGKIDEFILLSIRSRGLGLWDPSRLLAFRLQE